jgi:hypothetical protein
MRQYRITTADINPKSDDDCYIAPDDPMWAMMPASQMGGLGSETALANYLNSTIPQIKTNDKGQIAREQNIQPGTDAWFKHWFGDKR